MEPRARIFRAADTLRQEGDGVVTEILTPAETGASDLWFGRFATGPGFGIPPHHHTSDTIAYLVSGRARFRIGDDLSEILDMAPGDYVFVPRNVLHTEETIGDEGAEFILTRDGGGGSSIYRD